MPRQRKKQPNGKTLNGRSSVDQAVKNICDIMRRSNMAGAMQYVPELTWILFLRILDENQQKNEKHAEILGTSFTPALKAPYRWRDWAAPDGVKRKELQEGMAGGMLGFVNKNLLPHLKNLKNAPGANGQQKVISEVVSGVTKTSMDTERNFLDVIDKVHELQQEDVDTTHVFTLSQVYEGLLFKMGEKANDGGQFFTPREVIRAMVKVVNPQHGETVYDPCCGTGGFLAQSYEHMAEALGKHAPATKITELKEKTFYGREKENLVYPMTLANLVLHDIDRPHIWHGNTLTGRVDYGGLFEGAPSFFDVILTNPPFGGKESQDAQVHFNFKTSATQILFLQKVMDSLKQNGRCGMVVDEGALFRTNEDAFVKTKRKLLEEFNLWCIVKLPQGAFTQSGTGAQTNILFFNKDADGTKSIWYYDLSDLKINKGQPMTLAHFDEFFRLLPKRKDSEHSWSVDIQARIAEAKEKADALRKSNPKGQAKSIENAAFDLKAVNPNRKTETDTRTPKELLTTIAKSQTEITQALAKLQGMLA